MAEGRGQRPEDVQQRRGASPGATDSGDAVPPGIGAGLGGAEEGSRTGTEGDPGGAVPPGVAPLEPREPSEKDLRMLEKLLDLPRRG